MEVIALGLGYNNLRSTSKWDKVMDEREYDQYWQHQRNAIYEQYYEALKTGQEEEIAAARKALQKFNMDVAGTPARAYAISSEKLLQSMKARERARLGRESGIPVQKQNIPIAREIERLHPEAGNVIDVRRVR
jgi:preprotein translocase subunit SecA